MSTPIRVERPTPHLPRDLRGSAAGGVILASGIGAREGEVAARGGQIGLFVRIETDNRVHRCAQSRRLAKVCAPPRR